MNFSFYKIVIFIILFSLSGTFALAQMEDLKLPQPQISQGKSLRENIQERFSNRSFDNKKQLSLEQISSILWATYGKKIEDVDARTSASYVIPSAGAVYALEILLVVGKDSVENLRQGIYYYETESHSLKQLSDQDKRKELTAACLGQKFIEDAPISIIIAAQFGSMAQKYGSRAERYINFEAGHAAQNLYLIVNDLGLTTVEVGAFMDADVARVLEIEYPILLLMPIGYKK
ncbi:MAG: SagB/ThcOx family dehydrogenase [Candidatus Omnitrophota bacterium]